MTLQTVVFACTDCDFELPMQIGALSINMATGDISEADVADQIGDDLPPCTKCGGDVVAVIEGNGTGGD